MAIPNNSLLAPPGLGLQEPIHQDPADSEAVASVAASIAVDSEVEIEEASAAAEAASTEVVTVEVAEEASATEAERTECHQMERRWVLGAAMEIVAGEVVGMVGMMTAVVGRGTPTMSPCHLVEEAEAGSMIETEAEVGMEAEARSDLMMAAGPEARAAVGMMIRGVGGDISDGKAS